MNARQYREIRALSRAALDRGLVELSAVCEVALDHDYLASVETRGSLEPGEWPTLTRAEATDVCNRMLIALRSESWGAAWGRFCDGPSFLPNPRLEDDTMPEEVR